VIFKVYLEPIYVY